jgi:predicted aldo/keto reductase-like oxidoreductase
MKPMAGGHIEDAYLAFKYFTAFEDVVPLVGIESEEQVTEIVKVMDEGTPATAEEMKKMEAIRAESGNRFCRRCEYCMPCEHGVRILPITIFRSFGRRLPPETILKEGWDSCMETLEKCVQCGECEKRCPYSLDILDIFEETKAYYKELCEQFGPK